MSLLCCILTIVLLINSDWQVSAQSCNQNILITPGMTGLITSPNYPATYGPKTSCTYQLRSSDPARTITITFEAFDLEHHTLCRFDYLQVFDGPTNLSPLLGKHCGSRLPPAYSSSGQELTVVFKADESTSGDGFSIRYSAGCSYHLQDTSGDIRSPSYPENYPDSSDCRYNIIPRSGTQLLLSFLDFSLEDSADCKFDRLELSVQEDAALIAKYCGDLQPFKKLINSSKLTLKFASDRSVSRSGFHIQYSTSTDCTVNNGGCSHHCQVIVPGQVRCYCDQGYDVDKNGVQCVDIDECKLSLCTDQCSNTPGSFVCSCTQPGYDLSPDGRTCSDMTCRDKNGGCEQLCQSSGNGQFTCACHQGFVLADDLRTCKDVNECTTDDLKLRHRCEQTCLNEAGSYFCDCRKGYKLDDNGRTCSDVDECPSHWDDCDQDCRNVPGGWECSCYEGWEVDPLKDRACVNIDECDRGLAPENCHECIDTVGTYTCVCNQGFLSNDQETNCTDIDECLDNNGDCHQVCFNTPGSYRCDCQAGYAPRSPGSNFCSDINECAPSDGRGPCDHYCENSPGSFECACVGGFTLSHDGLQCEDINECENKNAGCQQQCVNTDGSFHCKCFVGYGLVNGTCTDIDECQLHPCDQSVKASCTNTAGSFLCECPPGYTVENVTTCQDVDECAFDNHGCSQLCHNLPGSYQCLCHVGYYAPSGQTHCVDIDECMLSPTLCNQTCVNTEGRFHCECNDGFYLLGDGHNCSDIDECATSDHHCEQVCFNEIGFHTCHCFPGYILNADNATCSDIEECVAGSSGCSDGCRNTIGSFECFCDGGFLLGDDNRTCEDFNECSMNNGGCQHICTNSNGSYSCGCDPGFVFDGRHNCTDINECANNNGGCNQTCINFDGSYDCGCLPTYKLLADNETCTLCPTCDDYRQITVDVTENNRLAEIARQLRDRNQALSAQITSLTSRIQWLEAHISSTRELPPPDATK